MRLLKFIWIKNCLEGLFISGRQRKLEICSDYSLINQIKYGLEKERNETKCTTETIASTEGTKHGGK